MINENEVKHSGITELKHFVYTSTEVRSKDEYHMVKAIYHTLGAVTWSYHKGYKALPPEDKCGCKLTKPHHLYGWEPRGFMKHAGIGESCKGTFSGVDELLEVARRVLDTTPKFDIEGEYILP